jgi:hypothetical protein
MSRSSKKAIYTDMSRSSTKALVDRHVQEQHKST